MLTFSRSSNWWVTWGCYPDLTLVFSLLPPRFVVYEWNQLITTKKKKNFEMLINSPVQWFWWLNWSPKLLIFHSATLHFLLCLHPRVTRHTTCFQACSEVNFITYWTGLKLNQRKFNFPCSSNSRTSLTFPYSSSYAVDTFQWLN